jgi:hypothetical protein
MRVKTGITGVLAGALALGFGAPAGAVPFDADCSTTASGSLLCKWDAPLVDGDADGNVAGSAEFSVSGDTLTIQLSALAPADGNVVDRPSEVLTGITFDSSLALDGQMAVIPAGSMLVNNGGGPGTNVSGAWAFTSGLSMVSNVWGDYGFGTLGGEAPYCTGECFGNKDLLDPLLPPGSVGGMEYGLVPEGAAVNLVNPPLGQKGPFIQSQLTLTATITGGLASSLSNLRIAHVVPIYGTNGTPPIPEPRAALLFVAGSLVVGFALRKTLAT